MALPLALNAVSPVGREPRWTDGLTEIEKARALERSREIASAVRALPWDSLRPGSLAAGWAGVAVFEAYRALGGEAGAAERCLELLEPVAGSVERDGSFPAFYEGSVGAAFVLEHIRRRLLDDGPGMLDSFDEALLDVFDHHPLGAQWLGTYDLVSGLVGIGAYAMERWPEPTGVRLLERVVLHLEATAERHEDGFAWWTPSSAVSERFQPVFGDKGYYNLGIAHGVPAVIALLAGAVRLDVCRERARPLLRGAVTWLRRWRDTAEGASRYPSWVFPDGTTQAARVAWCYGDPGVALALVAAARAESESLWWDDAVEVARASAAVPIESSGVIDAGLCHGAAGLTQVFGRLHQWIGGDDLAEAARRWLRATLAMALPGQGVGGYRTWNKFDDGSLGWTDDAGLLIGSTGVGLALWSASSASEPEWDRLLMASWPGP